MQPTLPIDEFTRNLYLPFCIQSNSYNSCMNESLEDLNSLVQNLDYNTKSQPHESCCVAPHNKAVSISNSFYNVRGSLNYASGLLESLRSGRSCSDSVTLDKKGVPMNSYFYEKPDNFRVKEAKKAQLANYKYSTCYKYNKKSGRNLRYYICEYGNCGRLFNKTWNFIDHVRIHTGDKPFTCNVCQRSFAQKGNLNKHVRLHTTQKK